MASSLKENYFILASMASPGFGFSAGDFIAAGKLIIDVTQALKDAGGATDDYRKVVAQIKLLRNVYQQFQAQQANNAPSLDSRNPFSPYVKQQVGLTFDTLAEFLKTLSKFDSKLGSQAKPGWFHGAGRKVQWAVLQGKGIEKLRAELGTQSDTLTLLLQLYLLNE